MSVDEILGDFANKLYDKELYMKLLPETKEALFNELVKGMPDKRKEDYYHQNHWKANVYNEGRDDCIESLRKVLLGEDNEKL